MPSGRLGLEPGKYVLYVSRMEPENNALLVRKAFEQVNTNIKLALVGDAPYAADYIARVKDTTRSAHRDSRRDLRRWLSSTAIALCRLRAGDRGWRHTSGIN